MNQPIGYYIRRGDIVDSAHTQTHGWMVLAKAHQALFEEPNTECYVSEHKMLIESCFNLQVKNDALRAEVERVREAAVRARVTLGRLAIKLRAEDQGAFALDCESAFQAVRRALAGKEG